MPLSRRQPPQSPQPEWLETKRASLNEKTHGTGREVFQKIRRPRFDFSKHGRHDFHLLATSFANGPVAYATGCCRRARSHHTLGSLGRFGLRQFLLDLAQTYSAQLKGGLIERRMPALFREAGIQVAQIGDFLTKAGETFRDIWHLFDHTLYLPQRRFISS